MLIEAIQRWVQRKVDSGDWQDSTNVRSLARKTSIWITLLATGLVFLFHALAAGLDVLPYPMFPAAGIGVAITIPITVTISYLIALSFVTVMGEVQVARAESDRLSRTDALSGLMNRRAFSELTAAAEEGDALLIFDIDHFKRINDRFGHAVGDMVIRTAALVLTDSFPNGAVARIGGEEFGVLLRRSTRPVMLQAESALAGMAARTTMASGQGLVTATLSGGIALYATGRSPEEVFRLADEALYLAKASGRNCVRHEADLQREAMQAG